MADALPRSKTPFSDAFLPSSPWKTFVLLFPPATVLPPSPLPSSLASFPDSPRRSSNKALPSTSWTERAGSAFSQFFTGPAMVLKATTTTTTRPLPTAVTKKKEKSSASEGLLFDQLLQPLLRLLQLQQQQQQDQLSQHHHLSIHLRFLHALRRLQQVSRAPQVLDFHVDRPPPQGSPETVRPQDSRPQQLLL